MVTKLSAVEPSTTGSTRESELETARARIRDLEAALGQKDKTLAVTFKLTPALSNVLGLLLALPAVTDEMVRQRLEIVTDTKVVMHRLRRHMKPYNVEIASRRNLGYWLENDTKDRIRKMLDEGVIPTPVALPESEEVVVAAEAADGSAVNSSVAA